MQYAKDIKEKEKQKIERVTEQKKKGEKASPGRPGTNQPNKARASPAARGPLTFPNRYPFSFPFSG
jgi:hypothetical protein